MPNTLSFTITDAQRIELVTLLASHEGPVTVYFEAGAITINEVPVDTLMKQRREPMSDLEKAFRARIRRN